MDRDADTGQNARVAQVVPRTEAEGPGRRWALWFQGCPLRCPGCCNPEFLPFDGGEVVPVAELIASLADAQATHAVEGISLLGGEPFAHAEAAALAVAAQERGLSVMVYTGFRLDALRKRIDAATAELLAHTDVLVDGPYLQGEPDRVRRWIGSRNQGLHFLSDRHHAGEACWSAPNTLEIRVRGSEVVVNGFPASAAAGLWKGWSRPAAPAPGAPS